MNVIKQQDGNWTEKWFYPFKSLYDRVEVNLPRTMTYAISYNKKNQLL